VSDHLERARQAAASASLLLEQGDAEGAANRAYYAAFHAARAILAGLAQVDVHAIKTHNGVKRLFEEYVGGRKLMDREIARLLRDIESTRIAADYGTVAVEAAEAAAAIQEAHTFIDACASLLDKAAAP
jgi:uncharacterized protein (UPF0332 family)